MEAGVVFALVVRLVMVSEVIVMLFEGIVVVVGVSVVDVDMDVVGAIFLRR